MTSATRGPRHGTAKQTSYVTCPPKSNKGDVQTSHPAVIGRDNIAPQQQDEHAENNRREALHGISEESLESYLTATTHKSPEETKTLTDHYINKMEDAIKQAAQAEKRILEKVQEQIGAQNKRIDKLEDNAEAQQAENARQFQLLTDTSTNSQPT